MVELGIYVGRFCPPHIGHNRVIQKLLADRGIGESLVMVGSSNHAISYRHLFSVGDRVIVLDDICDGGATFIQLAKHIKERYDSVKLHLFVAHGIFSKGVDCLLEWYQTLGTTDSFYTGNNQRVLVYPALG